MIDEETFNYLTIENGTTILSCSSQIAHCPIRNILTSDRRAIWVSDQGLPQTIVIELTNQLKRPKLYRCFGFDCWHDYNSNPSIIELHLSTDGDEYITWTVIRPELRAGVQLFDIDSFGTKYNFLKIVIKETFGAAKTYLNQVYLFEENPMNKLKSNRNHAFESLTNSEIQEKREENKIIQRNTPGSHSKYDNTNRNIENSIPRPPQITNEFNPNPMQSSSGYRKDSPGLPHSQSLPKLHQNQNQRSSSQETHDNTTYSHTHRPGSSQGGQNRPSVQNEYYNVIPSEKSDFVQRIGSEERKRPEPQQHPGEFYQNQTTSWQVTSPLNQEPTKLNNQTFFGNSAPSKQHSQISLLSEQITTARNEVLKIAQSKNVKWNEESKPEDEEEVALPLLTNTEKDVKKLKKEMKNWGAVIGKMQENVTAIMDKMNGFHDSFEDIKKSLETKKELKTETSNFSSKPQEYHHTTSQAHHSHQTNPLENPIVNEYMEALKIRIGGFLESLAAQNETILNENQKLRQNIELLVAERTQTNQTKQNDTYINKTTESPRNSPKRVDWASKDLEKTITNIFDKNIKAWESSLISHIKAQSESAEERIQKRVHQNVEALVSNDEIYKQRVDDEINRLKRRVDFLEQSKIKLNDIPTYSAHDEPIATYKENKLLNHDKSKDNLRDYQNTKRGKAYPPYQAEIPSNIKPLNETFVKADVERVQDHQNAGLNKIAYLMEKLQEKIAIRDKKVQMLQNEVSDKSDYGGPDDDLEESLFSKNVRPNLK